jgi:hypothetical protein
MQGALACAEVARDLSLATCRHSASVFASRVLLQEEVGRTGEGIEAQGKLKDAPGGENTTWGTSCNARYLSLLLVTASNLREARLVHTLTHS